MAIGLKERGVEVNVLTAKPNYPKGNFFPGYGFFKKQTEYWEGIKIYRSPLFARGDGSGFKLMINYFSFALFAVVRAFFIKEKFDLIFVYEPSPITVGIPAVYLSKKMKIPIHFWVQDLWPESVVSAGFLKNRMIIWQLNHLTVWIYSQCEKILIQSEAFKDYILNQGVTKEKITYYPNSTEALYKVVAPKIKFKNLFPKDSFSIIFAGNIGEAQDFETIIEASRLVKLKNSNIHFIILGEGRKKVEVMQKINDFGIGDNFHFLGSFPVIDMPDFFACGDALLVTLKQSEIFSLTIPSKLQSYLACGKPIIGALDGEGAKIIKESKSGLTSAAGDAEGLADNILFLYSLTNEERIEMSRNGISYFRENFEREMLLDKLLNIFNYSK